ncbi:hypothetical protein PMYN1_Chma496 (chromatophore) [Paulinella micropora]|uniref:YCII-related domain-containing protein n=1 Tax=Paulinella micropora TaxID=1928728 RepID=A0A1L5YC88_9EUKA|nr:hypothetical protein PCKR_546 [Paulinella micropora]AQX45092.1 hypothetical protein PFK_546 [Paulinella micropora]BBL86304.1 hypothetical protein PMYN1_Chma496 [Paulinella micropora]
MPWFVKTEVFRESRDQLGLFLEAHQNWIRELQAKGQPILSGFLVKNNKSPGGGLFLFYADNYSEAEKLIQQDPLIVNNCVQWELYEWVGAIK